MEINHIEDCDEIVNKNYLASDLIRCFQFSVPVKEDRI